MVGLLPFAADDQRNLVTLPSLGGVGVRGIDNDEEKLAVAALGPDIEFDRRILQFSQIGVAAFGHGADVFEGDHSIVEIAENVGRSDGCYVPQNL